MTSHDTTWGQRNTFTLRNPLVLRLPQRQMDVWMTKPPSPFHPPFTSDDERAALVAGGFWRTGVRVGVFSCSDVNRHLLTANWRLLVGRQQIIYGDKRRDGYSACSGPGRRQLCRDRQMYLVPGCERYPVHPAVEGSPLQTAGQRRRWNTEQIIQLRASLLCTTSVPWLKT